ncbi:MAG: hypothetical protein ABJA64_01220 [Candidatus Saccharibacteria bacterium]
MADVSKDDVQRAVQDGIRDVKDNMQRVKDSVQRIEQHTNGLERVQPMVEDFSRRSIQEFERLRSDSEDMKLRIQNIERGIQQITGYLQAQSKIVADEKGYKVE